MSRRPLRTLAACAASLAGFLACAVGTISITYLDPRPHSPRKPEEVVILQERPQGPHLVIASFRYETSDRYTTHDQVARRICSEAASLGGEAAVIYAEANRSAVIPAFLLGASPVVREQQWFVDVVVFPDRSTDAPGGRQKPE